MSVAPHLCYSWTTIIWSRLHHSQQTILKGQMYAMRDAALICHCWKEPEAALLFVGHGTARRGPRHGTGRPGAARQCTARTARLPFSLFDFALSTFALTPTSLFQLRAFVFTIVLSFTTSSASPASHKRQARAKTIASIVFALVCFIRTVIVCIVFLGRGGEHTCIHPPLWGAHLHLPKLTMGEARSTLASTGRPGEHTCIYPN